MAWGKGRHGFVGLEAGMVVVRGGFDVFCRIWAATLCASAGGMTCPRNAYPQHARKRVLFSMEDSPPVYMLVFDYGARRHW